MTKTQLRDIYKQGIEAGRAIASWTDMPEPGKTYRTDGSGKTRIESESDAEDVFMDLSGEAESNGRQFSPFEFTANDLNESDDPDEAWEQYEEGISEGFRLEWVARRSVYDSVCWDAIEAGKEGWDAEPDEDEE